ncbi:spermidine synthase [Legionella spiritensis]|uniref:spermidine synthase n=1 Tax=Legionella spiritensis TaxID=452 RepID=UPI000F6F93CB|nr:hypothetical protein [Legionella spiritensis]VEG90415.1 spermidine synthase [Legionella spiritensis]
MRWKTLGRRCIYRSEGIRIYDNLFFRWLTFDTRPIQTLINKWYPHRPELHYIKPLVFMAQQLPGDCCLLGLGGAGVAHVLAKPLNRFTITAVEMEAEIIHLASRYFQIDKRVNLSIVHQEASQYVRENHSIFRHVIVDLFNASSFPESCHNPEFFAHCKRLLMENGVLAVNLANQQEHKPIFDFIRRIFPGNTVVLPIPESANMVILAQKNETANTLTDFLKSTSHLKHLAWDPRWGCMAAIK